MAHGAVKYLLRVLEAAVLVVLLGAAVLAWRLNQGPIVMSAIAPYVSGALEDLNPGLNFRIDHAEFRWEGFDGQPQLIVRDVRVLDPSGGVIAGLPSMSALLNVSALMRGDIAPDSIRLSNPIIRFVHRADGTLGLGVEGSSPAPAEAPGGSANALAAALVGSLTTPASSDNPAGYLQSVSIDGTTLMLVDEISGRRWLTPEATLRFERDEGGVELHATLPVVEEGRSWDVTARGRFVASDSALSLDFNVEDFRPSRIADLAPQLGVLDMFDLGLSGVISTDLHLEGNGARIEEVRFDVRGETGRVHLQAPLNAGYPIRYITLKGLAGTSLDRIEISEFRAAFERGADEELPVVSASAVAENLNAAPKVNIHVGLNELSVEALKEYWPEEVKPNTRSWIEKNLSDGELTNTTASIRMSGENLSSVDVDDLSLTSELHGFTVQYIDGMPKVRNAAGRMTVRLDEVVIDLTGGQIPDLRSGEGLRVARGTLRMHNLGQRGTELADFDIDIVGDFGSAMRLIDHEPLGYASAVGMDASSAAGGASVGLELDFPLVKDLKLDQVEIGVQAAANNVAIPDVAFGLPLSEGRLDLTLDRAGMDVTGTVVLGGIPATLAWRENFTDDEIRSRYVVEPVVGNEDRPSIGLGMAPFTPPYIDGAVGAHVVYTIDRDNKGHLTAEVDLTEPAMSVPELGWEKKSGVEASAEVTARFNDGRLISVPSFAVRSGDDLAVSGSAEFDMDTKLKSLSISSSTVGETEVAGKLGRTDDGGYAIDVSGTAFNSTYFWTEFGQNQQRKVDSAGEEANSETTPITLRANFDRMWLTSQSAFTDVSLNFESDAEGVRAIDFKSKVNGNEPFTFSLTSDGDQRTFSGSSADGGGVVRAVGLFGDIEGGQLEINGTLDPEGAVKGLAEIRDFKLVDAPLVARLLSVAALTGILDELRGEGISFDTLRVPFSYANSSLSVQDGEMFGNALGLTGEGRYDFASSTMNFNGTLIPAYTINSALNSIPLLGNILSGGDEGGGLFAATYSYRGDVATAQPTVNPLAALAPGFLRHIFDIFKSRPQEASVPREEPKTGNDAAANAGGDAAARSPAESKQE